MPQSEHGRARRHPGLPDRPGFGADLSRQRVDRGPGVRSVDVPLPPSAATVRVITATGSRPEPAHAHRPRLASSARALALGVATTVVVFALAVALVTVLEVVVDHPLSGGAPGATTLGEMIHPSAAPPTR